MNYLLYCKSHKCEGDKMHTVQKEACCIFFFLLLPTQLFHRDADVVAVAKSRFRHDCVRIRALCNEFWRARAVSSQIPITSNAA